MPPEMSEDKTRVTRWAHGDEQQDGYTIRRLLCFDEHSQKWTVCHDRTPMYHFDTEEFAIKALLRWKFKQTEGPQCYDVGEPVSNHPYVQQITENSRVKIEELVHERESLQRRVIQLTELVSRWEGETHRLTKIVAGLEAKLRGKAITHGKEVSDERA